MKMKVEQFTWIKIRTPMGEAKLQDYVWKSENKEFEKELNKEFGKNASFLTYEQIHYGVAPFILADQAIRKYGGKIIRTRKHTVEKPDESVE